MPDSRQTRVIIGLVLALISNLLILTMPSPDGRCIGWLLLFCLIPGYIWVTGLLPIKARDNELDHLVLSISLSIALSILIVLNVQRLPGEMTLGRVLLGNDLLVIAGIVVALLRSKKEHISASGEIGRRAGFHTCRQAVESCPAEINQYDSPLSSRIILILLAVLLLGVTLRVVNLGYSEFQDDEVDIVQVSVQAIQGDKYAVLNDTRGPARTMLAASFFLCTNRTGEIEVRWPVALASVAGIVAVFCLGRRLFNPAAGLIAAAILAVEGITLGYGRIVQQESLVNLMAAAAILCFLLAGRRRTQVAAGPYRAIGALLFAAGLLAHYEIGLIGPLLLWLWIAGEGWDFIRRSWQTVTVGVVILILILGSFYLPFLLSPGFDATYQHYSGDILGSGLTDNLAQFMSVMTFYNSIYLVVPLILLLIFAYSYFIAQWKRWLGWLYGLGSLVVWGAGLVYPGGLASLGLFWFGSLIVVTLAVRPRKHGQTEVGDVKSWPGTRVAFKIIFAWLMIYFIPYLFIVGLPRMHYYTFALPWSLVSGYGLFILWGVLKNRPVRFTLALALVVCYALATYHGLLLFVGHTPEWAMVQSDKPLPLHPALHSSRPGEAFGFPQKSGWKTIAGLYRDGALRGPYETNELRQKADWYVRRLLREPGENRYYIIAESPHRIQAGPPPEPFNAQDYRLAGVVTVAEEPKLRIFERKDGASIQPAPVVTYTNETFEAGPGAIRSLDTYRLWREYEADDRFYQEIARYLETAARQGDALVLDHPAQVELLSLYYRGDLPYYPLPNDNDMEQSLEETLGNAASTHSRLFAVLWAVDAIDPEHRVERWLDENLFKADERWFGNIRLAVYAVPREPVIDMAHEVNARLGSHITLQGYSAQGEPFHGGDILPLRLFWRFDGPSPISQRYKVFIHVLDDQGQIVAQRDSEPAGGSRPTDTWRPGDQIGDNQGIQLPANIPAGDYQIAMGMYDPTSGARLPAADAQGGKIPDDRILLGTVEITSP